MGVSDIVRRGPFQLTLDRVQWWVVMNSVKSFQIS
jgi:hypothetical protein